MPRYEVVCITMNEGQVANEAAKSLHRIRDEKADHSNTLLYHGDAEEMRDILRMHNICTAYMFLLDGAGRVRWAGSGEGLKAEVESMIVIARDLMQPSSIGLLPVRNRHRHLAWGRRSTSSFAMLRAAAGQKSMAISRVRSSLVNEVGVIRLARVRLVCRSLSLTLKVLNGKEQKCVCLIYRKNTTTH